MGMVRAGSATGTETTTACAGVGTGAIGGSAVGSAMRCTMAGGTVVMTAMAAMVVVVWSCAATTAVV